MHSLLWHVQRFPFRAGEGYLNISSVMAVIQKTHKAVFKGVEDQEEVQKSLPEQKSKIASRCVEFF